jgi:hypothetical protein
MRMGLEITRYKYITGYINDIFKVAKVFRQCIKKQVKCYRNSSHFQSSISHKPTHMSFGKNGVDQLPQQILRYTPGLIRETGRRSDGGEVLKFVLLIPGHKFRWSLIIMYARGES